MDDRDLETVPDDESSLASWETCSELESEQSMIDEDHFSGHYLDHGLDQLYFNGNVAVQDGESSSATWGTYSKSFSEQVEDDSFDQVLDVLSSDSNVSISKRCEHCQILVNEFPDIGRRKGHSGFAHNTLIPHAQYRAQYLWKSRRKLDALYAPYFFTQFRGFLRTLTPIFRTTLISGEPDLEKLHSLPFKARRVDVYGRFEKIC
jgi:hypothetical protein